MRLVVAEARKCEGEKDIPTPFVGAAVVRNGELLAAGHRSETSRGDHAEYVVLEHKLTAAAISGGTLYTTLEPCTHRNPPKVPCVERIIRRKIARVVVGMLDPNQTITGKGILLLRSAGIDVELFPAELMGELEELNRDFTEHHTPQRREDPKWLGALAEARRSVLGSRETLAAGRVAMRAMARTYRELRFFRLEDLLELADGPLQVSEQLAEASTTTMLQMEQALGFPELSQFEPALGAELLEMFIRAREDFAAHLKTALKGKRHLDAHIAAEVGCLRSVIELNARGPSATGLEPAVKEIERTTRAQRQELDAALDPSLSDET